MMSKQSVGICRVECILDGVTLKAHYKSHLL